MANHDKAPFDTNFDITTQYSRSVPGKRVFPVSISAIMQPTDQMSTVRL